MARIQIPITKMGGKTNLMNSLNIPNFVGLFMIIVFSGFLGAFIEAKYPLLVLPIVNPQTQLGAVVDALPNEQSGIKTEADNTARETIDAGESQIRAAANENSQTLANNASPTPPPALSRINELNIFINERENALAQVNNELERIKDQSITLIAEFNQNCGNWKDDCAKPYTNELEVSNTRYSLLTKTLTTLTQELSNAELEERDLTSP